MQLFAISHLKGAITYWACCLQFKKSMYTMSISIFIPEFRENDNKYINRGFFVWFLNNKYCTWYFGINTHKFCTWSKICIRVKNMGVQRFLWKTYTTLGKKENVCRVASNSFSVAIFIIYHNQTLYWTGKTWLWNILAPNRICKF